MTKKELMLSSLCHSYACMVVNETEERKRNTIWYKHAVDIDKFFEKRRYKKQSELARIELDSVFNKVKSLDADYFIDKQFSPYICMLYCLDYLMNELRETSLRVKFGHMNTLVIINEIETTEDIKGVGKDTFRFFSKLLDIVDTL